MNAQDTHPLNLAIATEFWRLPDTVLDAPWFSMPDYSHDWFESALIVSHIKLNGSHAQRQAFDRALQGYIHQSAAPSDVLLVCAPYEICTAALSAVRYAK